MTPTLTRTTLLALALTLLIAADSAWSQTIRYYHTDITGSVVAVTDEQGNVVERRQYEPYGLPQSAIPDGPGYTGHDMDGETGLVYMQQRYYDPMVGRFISQDPMAVDTTTAWNFNRYNYAANNPYRYTDPDGRERVQILLDQDIRAVASGSITAEQFTDRNFERAVGAAAGLVVVAATRALLSVAPKGTRPNGVPKDWMRSPSRKGGGERYRNPDNKHDEVRSMPGNPNSSNPAQRSPYVKRQANGKSYDVKGNEVPASSEKAHIPRDEFKFIPREKLK